MSSLHQLNSADRLPLCLPFLAAGDRLLLIEEAVILALDPQRLEAIPSGVQLLFLAEDLKARGLSQYLPAAAQALSDHQWVSSTLEVDRVCSW